MFALAWILHLFMPSSLPCPTLVPILALGRVSMERRGAFWSMRFQAVRLSHTVLTPARDLPVVSGVETLLLPDAWGLR